MKLENALKKLASLNIEVSNHRARYDFELNGWGFSFFAQDGKAICFMSDGMAMSNLTQCLRLANGC